MYKLKKSDVVFYPATHTYITPDGRMLDGITGMLSRQLFPGKYDGIDEETMRNAAERGSFIHSVCELVDSLGVEHESPEAIGYKELKETYALKHEESEYLVSDNEHFASCIDKVYRDGESTFTLADIKTTYKLDKEYVRWQLSVYAYLFERQNPGAKVLHLYAIWLRRERHELVEVERIPDDVVVSLMEHEVNGEQFANPYAPSFTDTSLQEKYAAMEDAIAEIDRQYKYWSEKKKELSDGVKFEMQNAGVSKWVGDRVSFTRKEDSEREDFDKKRFASDHPDLYKAYLIKTKVSGSVILKVNSNIKNIRK